MGGGDQALRGVTPFRYLVGVAVLAWLAFALVRLGCNLSRGIGEYGDTRQHGNGLEALRPSLASASWRG